MIDSNPKRPRADRRGPDRRVAERPIEGPDRRQAERRTETDRRKAPRY